MQYSHGQPYLRGDIDMLEKVQRRPAKFVSGYKKLSHEERLCRLGLTTFEQRRLRGFLLKRTKLSLEKKKLQPTLLTIWRHFCDTRYHCYKLTTTRSGLALRRNFFSQRVVRHWNKLPEIVVNASRLLSIHPRIGWTKSGAIKILTELFRPTATSTSIQLFSYTAARVIIKSRRPILYLYLVVNR